MKDLSLHQTLVAIAALVGITVLAALSIVDASVVVGIYGTVLGSAIGYINGKKSGKNDG